jgi:hypothetical protein
MSTPSNSHVPLPLRWMTPIVVELTKQDASGDLNASHLALIRHRLTPKIRRHLEQWIDQDDSPAAKNFSLALVRMDELGLLDASEPVPDFEFWLSEVSSPVWGKRRRAILQIKHEFLGDLSEQEVRQLQHALSKLSLENHPNTRIWTHWLNCYLERTSDTGIRWLRMQTSALLNSSSDRDDDDDVQIDAWKARLTVPQTDAEDFAAAEMFIASTHVDGLTAASVFEIAWESNVLSDSQRGSLRETALRSGRDELVSAAIASE